MIFIKPEIGVGIAVFYVLQMELLLKYLHGGHKHISP